MEPRRASSTGTCSTTPRTPACSAWCATSTASIAASRRCIAATASRRASAGSIGDDRDQQRLRLSALGGPDDAPVAGRLQLHAGAAPRLPHRRAARRPLARVAQHRFALSTAAAMSATAAASQPQAVPAHGHAAVARARLCRRWRRCCCSADEAEHGAACPTGCCPARRYPLGATWDGLGVNFAVFSANATAIELCLFDRAGRREIARARRCPNAPTRSGTATCPTRGRACSTAIARTGPTSREHGHRFNPNKLLLDPYAQGARRRACAGPTRCSAIASARRAPTSPSTGATARPPCRRRWWSTTASTGATTARPRAPWADTVIYEAHVRGLTMRRHGPAAGRARHLRRAWPIRASSTTCNASASPRSSCCRSTPSSTTASAGRTGLTQLLGLQHASASSRREPRYLADNAASTNCAIDGAPPARRRHRGHPRRRLQPHRRRQTSSARRCRCRGLDNASYYRLLAGQRAPLHQRHRHRQHAEPLAIRACCRW